MANRLKMAAVDSIIALLRAKWSQRKIARELGVSRDAVSHYARQLRLGQLTGILPPPWPGPAAEGRLV